jgi:Amt family ammonium transporter
MAANPAAIGHIAMTTNLAAAIATLTAALTSTILQKKPDLTMILNGCLAGLVAVTAPCAYISMPAAALIGAVAGIIVVLAVIGFDKLKLDDPVGALSVHLVNGIFGTIAVGLFADKNVASAIGTDSPALRSGLFAGGGAGQLIAQFIAVLSVGAFVFGAASVVWLVIKAIMGLRVTREEELAGLDLGEHGMEAYSGFQIFTNI